MKLIGKAIIAMGGGPTAVINQSLVGAVLHELVNMPTLPNFMGHFVESKDLWLKS